MLVVEGKCINWFVYRVIERERDMEGERERWRKREREKEEGALSLEDSGTTPSLHDRLFHPKLSQQNQRCSIDQPVETLNKPAAIDA